eukprot:TRINITY_DN20843_c0_g1_i1.p1 TRINITY_DN20843_c0_g1~~TRINITY_DN20843_c0_g1_i1.p1  ORF type:complete len:496 (+),score=119.29 TRINITY_DN20843_c0_g1_i1:73-1560(+)
MKNGLQGALLQLGGALRKPPPAPAPPQRADARAAGRGAAVAVGVRRPQRPASVSNLRSCNTAVSVLNFLDAESAPSDQMLCAAASRVARHKGSSSSEETATALVLRRTATALSSRLRDCDLSSVASALWAFQQCARKTAEIKHVFRSAADLYSRPGWTARLVGAGVLASVVRSFVLIRARADGVKLVKAVAAELKPPQLGQLTCNTIALLVSSPGYLRIRTRGIVDGLLAEASTRDAGVFRDVDLVGALWAAAALRSSAASPLFASAAEELQHRWQTIAPDTFTAMVWAYAATAEASHCGLLARVAAQRIDQGASADARPHDLVLATWALSALHLGHGSDRDTILADVRDSLARAGVRVLGTRLLTILLTALARLGATAGEVDSVLASTEEAVAISGFQRWQDSQVAAAAVALKKLRARRELLQEMMTAEIGRRPQCSLQDLQLIVDGVAMEIAPLGLGSGLIIQSDRYGRKDAVLGRRRMMEVIRSERADGDGG